MEQENVTAGLPIAYQQVLAWVDDGRSADDIAADLGIDVQAVDPLITLAQAKLARLADDQSPLPEEQP